jgi:diguanylate cyclase (GGDEF)-like protein
MGESAAIVNRRVLVIDDNPAIHKDFRKVLGAGLDEPAALEADEQALFGAPALASTRPHFEVDSALQGQEGVERVREALRVGRPYAMAIVDMQMPPGWDGLETIERLWRVDPDVQVVICSAHAGYDWTELVVRLGHADKLLVVKKPFEPIEVLQCANALTRKWQNEWVVRRQVETLEKVVTDRTEGLEAANAQLRYLATHDALTGLPNRALLEDRISQAMTLADGRRQPFALMLLDLDRFKSVNDSMGHRAGDELLKEVAQRLRSVVRGVDTVARLGGDEFVLVLQSVTEREECLRVAERALAALAPTIRIQGVELHASTSIGIAFHPKDGDSMALLLNHADVAMYCAKQRGRNNVQCFASGMNAMTQEKLRVESDLESALRLGQLELHYQPKVDTATGEVDSAEALIRWRHPDRGLVPPADFIPIAEDCGLIGPIGDWVVREACRQGRAWQDAGLPPIRIAVNLSPTQFRHGNLLATIRHALDDARLEARFLEVELTESAVMSEPEASVTILEQLSQMGVLVSVDDFGTGYSSMSYLRRLPVAKLKIDREFIREVMSRPDDASIVRAIVSLAHSLRLKVVAEGVETAEQLEFLKTLGCDQYQGYYFSPAVPAKDFVALLERSAPGDRSLTQDPATLAHDKLAA